MKRIIGIGSCLANLIGANIAIMFDCKRDYFVAHNRSDNIIRYYVEHRSAPPPSDNIFRLVEWKPEFITAGREMIQNQYPEYLGYQELRQTWTPDGPRLLSDLRDRQYDIIIMDNFPDLFYRLMTFRDRFTSSPLLVPLHMCENFREVAAAMTVSELLSATESALNWRKIYRWLRAMQPRAHFVFACFSYSEHYSDALRHRMTIEYGDAIRRELADEDVLVLPPLNLAAEDTNPEEDWSHLQPHVYRGLAGFVWTKLYSGWKGV